MNLIHITYVDVAGGVDREWYKLETIFIASFGMLATITMVSVFWRPGKSM